MSGCNEPQRSTDDAHNSFSPEDGFVLLPPPICTSVMLAARVQRNRRVSSTRASYRSRVRRRVRRAPRVCAAASPGATIYTSGPGCGAARFVISMNGT